MSKTPFFSGECEKDVKVFTGVASSDHSLVSHRPYVADAVPLERIIRVYVFPAKKRRRCSRLRAAGVSKHALARAGREDIVQQWFGAALRNAAVAAGLPRRVLSAASTSLRGSDADARTRRGCQPGPRARGPRRGYRRRRSAAAPSSSSDGPPPADGAPGFSFSLRVTRRKRGASLLARARRACARRTTRAVIPARLGVRRRDGDPERALRSARAGTFC